MKDTKSFWTSETQMYYERKKIVKADGCYVWDNSGKRYLDANSGSWNVFLGHNRPEFVEAIQCQLNKFHYVNSNLQFYHEAGEVLATRLISQLPSSLYEHVFFTSGGAEAVETALKMARQYWYNRGKLGKYRIISLYESYHGSTLGANSVSGDPWDRIPFDPMLKDTLHFYPQYCYKCRLGQKYGSCNSACVRDLIYQIEFYGAENISALILEPIMGVGGVIIPQNEYLKQIINICHQNDIIVIFDEITSGIGRSGSFFSCTQFDAYPDIILFGKSISNGVQPLAGVIVGHEIYKAFYSMNKEKQFRHGFTNSAHPLSCCAGNTVMDIFDTQFILTRCNEKSHLFIDKLAVLHQKEYVGEIRVIGLMIAIELINPVTHKELVIPNLDILLRDNGVLSSQMNQVICFMPPVIINVEEIDTIISTLQTVIEKYLEQNI